MVVRPRASLGIAFLRLASQGSMRRGGRIRHLSTSTCVGRAQRHLAFVGDHRVQRLPAVHLDMANQDSHRLPHAFPRAMPCPRPQHDRRGHALQRVQSPRQKHQAEQHADQVAFAVAIVVTHVHAAVLQHVEGLVFDAPARPRHTHEAQQADAVRVQPQAGVPGDIESKRSATVKNVIVASRIVQKQASIDRLFCISLLYLSLFAA